MKTTFKNRLLKLANIIENKLPVAWGGKPVTFDMSNWMAKDSCGTAACIAGHAAILSGQPFDATAWMDDEASIEGIASRWLGFKNTEDAEKLFIPTDYGYRGALENITRRRAAAVLRNFAETGKITWNMKLPASL